jgi:3-hydroxyisobutyrate dehydrogenase-like beta-hydroxyacid dehydrogenase
MTDRKIAVIGLGQMGAAMAARLAECGYDVRGYDISATARQALEAQGIATVDRIVDVLRDRTVVLTSLPDPRAVRAVWLEPGGVVEHAAGGSLCIDLSTIDPATMREAGAAATACNLAVLDCPVSGSPNEARSGRLVMIAGGERSTLERAQPLLAYLGTSTQYTGAVGTAKVVKIVNNMMSMGNVLVAAEAFALGEASGVSPDTLFEVLSNSGGRSHHFQKRFPNALKGDFRPGFKLELGEKDLALAIDLGRQMKLPTPAASQVRELYALALAEGYRGQDIVALLSLYRRWAQNNEGAASD